MKQYYYVTTDGVAGYTTDDTHIPQNACIVTDGQCMISAPTNSWTAPAYIHAILPDASKGRTIQDCVDSIMGMLDQDKTQDD